MNRQDSHRGVECTVAKWLILGDRADRAPARALRDHRAGRLYGSDVPVRGFVGSAARPEIADRLGVAQRCVDLGGDSRVGDALARIARPDAVVDARMRLASHAQR